MLRAGHQPDVAAGQPGVRKLGLPAVHDLLLEDTVFVKDGITHSGVVAGGQRVHEAGRQTAQTAVAQAGVRLLLKQRLHVDAEAVQRLAEQTVHLHVVDVVFQRTAQQELHAQIVGVFAAAGLAVRHKVPALVTQQVAGDQGAGFIENLVRSGVYGVAHGFHLFLKQDLQLFHRQVRFRFLHSQSTTFSISLEIRKRAGQICTLLPKKEQETIQIIPLLQHGRKFSASMLRILGTLYSFYQRKSTPSRKLGNPGGAKRQIFSHSWRDSLYFDAAYPL